MKQYQPEFIEVAEIKSLLQSLVPFLTKESEGRYWLNMLNPNWETEDDENKRLWLLRKLIAEGKNAIDKNDNLSDPINQRNHMLGMFTEFKDETCFNDIDIGLFFQRFEPLEYDCFGKCTRYLSYQPNLFFELAFFTAWEKLVEKQHEDSVHKRKKPADLTKDKPIDCFIPMAIKKLADENLIQETEEGSNVFINQRESLEGLKRAIIARKIECPLNKDIKAFVFRIDSKTGEIKSYCDSNIRKAFKRS